MPVPRITQYQSPIATQHLGSEMIFFSLPGQTCDGCSVLHFHFCRSQPIYKKAWPGLGAASVFTVQIEVLFQKHLSEHNHILFCWCHTLYSRCTSLPASILFPVTPGAVACSSVSMAPSLRAHGLEPQGAFPCSPFPAAECHPLAWGAWWQHWSDPPQTCQR